MHIVHVTHRAWPVIGGSERYVQEIARRQVMDRHRVTVVATDAIDLSALWNRRGRRVDPNTPTEHQGVRIKRLPMRRLPLGDYTFPAIRWLAWLTSNLSKQVALLLAQFSPWAPMLRRALAEESIDLLFAWNITLEGLTAAVTREASRRSAPWIAVPLLHLGRSQFYTMPHQLDLLCEASAVLAQTPSERKFLQEHGLPTDKVHIVSPGVDPAEGEQADGQGFRQAHHIEGPMVLSAGALSHAKGTHHLIAAARQLWNENHPLTVVLIGRAEKSVQHLLEEIPDQRRACCQYLGEVSEKEKWDAMDAADMVAMPSQTESFGIVFLEAWARGKPVVGARAGAVQDVIDDGGDGLLVEFGDVAGLAEALRKLLDNPTLAAEMGQRGRDKVHRVYTWEHQYARWRAVVNEVMR
jgi:glycogen(starch) synthase